MIHPGLAEGQIETFQFQARSPPKLLTICAGDKYANNIPQLYPTDSLGSFRITRFPPLPTTRSFLFNVLIPPRTTRSLTTYKRDQISSESTMTEAKNDALNVWLGDFNFDFDEDPTCPNDFDHDLRSPCPPYSDSEVTTASSSPSNAEKTSAVDSTSLFTKVVVDSENVPTIPDTLPAPADAISTSENAPLHHVITPLPTANISPPKVPLVRMDDPPDLSVNAESPPLTITNVVPRVSLAVASDFPPLVLNTSESPPPVTFDVCEQIPQSRSVIVNTALHSLLMVAKRSLHSHSTLVVSPYPHLTLEKRFLPSFLISPLPYSTLTPATPQLNSHPRRYRPIQPR